MKTIFDIHAGQKCSIRVVCSCKPKKPELAFKTCEVIDIPLPFVRVRAWYIDTKDHRQCLTWLVYMDDVTFRDGNIDAEISCRRLTGI